ncbi:MAG: DUF1501 domain-containing protein [Verrucomicrobiales bacterium]|nr:DUF1501 domain-containing protein [Verrucomicrobiales bacterium]
MNPLLDHSRQLNRRNFFQRSASGIGQAALGSLLYPQLFTNPAQAAKSSSLPTPHPAKAATGLPGFPNIPATAKRVIYLFQSGGPSHVDLFDYKPSLLKYDGTDVPASVLGNQRTTGMTSNQKGRPTMAPLWGMKRCGQHGTYISDLLPHTQSIADDITIVRSVHTEAINHDPAMTFINTGSQQLGHASLGSWLSYGLGSENSNLPAYMVLLSQGTGKNPGQPLFSRLWGNGYLPSSHQGVQLRPGSSPVLYLANPKGVSPKQRRRFLDDLEKLNQQHAAQVGDPEIQARIDSYEMAYRMQTSVPDLTDFSDEPQHVLDLYGPEVAKPGSYAANCLMARRMAERGVRFIQLFHRGWDQHVRIREQFPRQCHDTDQASAALIKDLKMRGLLEDTLVIWGGEFGRTVFSQGKFGDPTSGRDHHGRCFSIWMAGGGVKAGFDYGRTDDFCYNIVENPMHIRDLNATLLHTLGIDHERLTYKFNGLDARLTGVEPAKVALDILA